MTRELKQPTRRPLLLGWVAGDSKEVSHETKALLHYINGLLCDGRLKIIRVVKLDTFMSCALSG